MEVSDEREGKKQRNDRNIGINLVSALEAYFN